MKAVFNENLPNTSSNWNCSQSFCWAQVWALSHMSSGGLTSSAELSSSLGGGRGGAGTPSNCYHQWPPPWTNSLATYASQQYHIREGFRKKKPGKIVPFWQTFRGAPIKQNNLYISLYSLYMYLSIFVFFTVVSFFYDIATLRCYTSIFDGFICFYWKCSKSCLSAGTNLVPERMLQ